MRRALLALWLLGACADAPLADGDAQVEVRSWLDGPVSERGGMLVIQTRYDPDGEVDLPRPEVEGLEFDPRDEPIVERVGDHEVLTQRYRFSGRKGMYEIGPLVAAWHGPDEVVQGASSPIFVDMGVEPPRETEPEDIVDPDRVFVMPWAVVGGAAAALALLGGGLVVAFGTGRRREIPEAPPEPPDVIALRAWEAVRADSELDDFAKAQHLSRIFRAYAEAVLAFPATAWTTTEILAHLAGLAHLPEGNVPRAKRLLRATDKVKFAEYDPDRDFFEDLDADLRAFVGSTRPRVWEDSR